MAFATSAVIENTGDTGSVGRETSLALRNATKLGASFGLTLLVAFAVRFWLPRFLGPAAYGTFQFGEAFATSFFVFAVLGIDVYVAKEVAVRRDHASDFMGGLIVLRVLIGVLLLGVMAIVLRALGKSQLEWHLVQIFGLWQLAFAINSTFAAVLNAHGTVGALAVTNVVSKVVWGGGIVAATLVGGGLMTIAACIAASEVGKALVLFWVVRKQTGMRLGLHPRTTWTVVVASMPFFLAGLAQKLYAKIDINMLSVMISDEVVGWYGAAANLAGIILLFIPIINAVLQPMAARIGQQDSTDAMNRVMSATVRLTLVVSVPIGMTLFLHAQGIVSLLLGADYGPAVGILRVLSLTFPCTYICTMSALHLIQLGRGWTVTVISVVTLVAHPTSNLVLIRWFDAAFDFAGAPAVGAALASVLTEMFNMALFFYALRHESDGRRFVPTAAKLLVIVGAVAGLHSLVAWKLALWSMIPELLLFVLMAWAWDVLPLGVFLERLRSGGAPPPRQRQPAAAA